jgi:Rha family phage regulatory protein
MNELVKNIDGKAVTTSRKVAEIFEKEHKNILQAIRNLEIPSDYRELNFQPSVYEQPNPSGGKPIQQPEYLITRDGFTILAMGFTGKKAMQFKIAYIEAFNAMEAQLKECSVSRPVEITTSTAALIEKINLRLIAGMEVEREVLRYAWNIGRLVGKTLAPQKHVSGIENFIMGIAAGEYPRHEIYEAYCANCANPVSARRFWPIVRGIRPCSEIRRPYCRLVVF